VRYLRTLGELHLEGGSGHLSSPRKELTLLTYLIRHEGRGVSRAELADLLWGSKDSGRARQSLRQALVELKRTFNEELVIDQERVSVIPHTLKVDVIEFEQDLAAGHPEAALDRWGGDFLAECEDLGSESSGKAYAGSWQRP
jgi:DNA-binding SARP family transcriptional activator